MKRSMGLSLLMTMAWRNLGRNRRRTVITLGAMVVGVGLCIPMYGLMDGMSAQMIRTITQVHLGNIQVHKRSYVKNRSLSEAFPVTAADQARKVSGVLAVSPRVYTGGMVTSEHRFQVALRRLGRSPIQVHQGRTAAPDRCEVVLAAPLARTWSVDLGAVLRLDPLPLSGRCEELEVVGLTRAGPKDAAYVPDRVYSELARQTEEGTHEPKGEDWDIDALPKLPEPKAGAQAPSTAPDERARPEPAPPKEAKEPARRSGPLPWALVRPSAYPVGIVAVDPKREARVTVVAKQLQAGSYLPEVSTAKGPLPLLLGENLAKRLAVAVGDEVGLDMMTPDGYPVDGTFRVCGLFKTGADELDRAVVFVPMEVAWSDQYLNLRDPKTGLGLVHELAIRTKRGVPETSVARKLREVLPKDLLARTWRQVDPSTARILQVQNTLITIFLGIVFLIAALGTANTMLMAVHERTKEFGVLKSIGLKPVQVAALILLETACLAVAAGVLGGLLGLGVDAYLVRYGLDLTSVNPEGFTYQGILLDPVWRATLTPRVFWTPILLLTAVSLAVAVWPAVRAGRIQPVRALRMEG